MSYRNSQTGQGWEVDWLCSDPYAYAEKVTLNGVERWEIIRTAPHTLDGLRGLVELWKNNGRRGAVIYDGHTRGFPVDWIPEALAGGAKHAPDNSMGACYGPSRLAFDHSEDNPFFGFDHDNRKKGVNQ